MKKIALLAFAVMVSFGVFFSTQNKEQTTSFDQLRDHHQALIDQHPYSKTQLLTKNERKSMGLPPNAYFEQQYLLQMNPITGKVETEKLYAVQQKLNDALLNKNTPGNEDNMWEERGPFNVPGRTRAILFDPNDSEHHRVFAGGVSGGLWKSENITTASSLWERVGIPENLAISAITADVNNPQNMFIGTGESYVQGSVNGNGIWRSTDGGTTWNHVFGGSTGETYYNGNATLTIHSPGSIAGEISGFQSNSEAPAPEPITADLVLVDDGSAAPTEGCGVLINGAEINGKIAVVERGECFFVDKIMNAQNAGAVAVIIINNVAGTPITMDISNGTSIDIPTFMITENDGVALMSTMGTETVNVTFAYDTDNDPAGVLVPGAFHVNDIRTRDNEGVTEIYAAITDSSYTGGAIMGPATYGLYKSVDNGENWTKLTLPATEGGNEYMANDIEIGADNRIWIGTTKSVSYDNGGGVVLSSIDGMNFEVVYTVPGGGLRTELAVSATDPNLIYILAGHKISSINVLIMKTTDAFATNPSNLAKPNDVDPGIPSNDFTRGQAFYDLMIAVDPNNDDILYVGGVDSFRSTNGGSSWQQMSRWANIGSTAPYVHADQHELVFDPNDSNKGIMATDGGVFYASSFSDAVTGSSSAISVRKWYYNTTQFYKGAIGQDASVDKLLAGAQDNGSFIKNNAQPGLNIMSEVYGGDGTYCFIDADGEYLITSTPGNSFRRHSITGSVEVTLINENSGSFVNVAELDDNMDILYTNASTSTGLKIARISDVNGSHPRSNITSDLLLGSPTALKASPYTTASSTLFVGTTRGNVFKVENANATPTWTNIRGDQFFGSVSAINFGENEDEIMVTFHNYGVISIWFTQDGGATWMNKEGDFPDIPVKDIMMNPLLNDEVIIATDLGVWMTADFDVATPHWVRSQNGMQNVIVTSFDLRTADNTVLASTYGRGLFTGQFNAEPAGITANELSEAIQIYPTVSNGDVYIKANTSFVNTAVNIFDVQGKRVYTSSLDLDHSAKQIHLNLQTGIYFVKFSNAGLIATKRIIIE